MVFTQCGILNPDRPDVGKNRRPFVRQRTERIELRHYLGLSTDLKTVSCHSN